MLHAVLTFIRSGIIDYGIRIAFWAGLLSVIFSLFRPTFAFAAFLGKMVSYFFVFALWFTSLDIAYHIVGTFWLLVSLFFFGIGPVIITFCALAWYGAWTTFGVQAFLFLSGVGMRAWVEWRAYRFLKKGEFAA